MKRTSMRFRLAGAAAVSMALGTALVLGGCVSSEEAAPASDSGSELAQTSTDTSYGKPIEGLPDPLSIVAQPGIGCVECHASEGFRPLPADHDGRDDSTCLSCHQVNTEGAGAPIPHAIGD